MRSYLKAFQLVTILSLFFIAMTVFAQAPPPDTGLTESPVFRKDCSKCHGKTAEGRHFGGPSLVSDKIVATSDAELRDIIANGKHRMPKFTGKLTPEEIDTLVQQIKAANKK